MRKIFCLFSFLSILSSILYAEQVHYYRYDKQEMGTFYREAEKYKEEAKWNEVVDKGKEIVSAEWEKRIWEDLTKNKPKNEINENEIRTP